MLRADFRLRRQRHVILFSHPTCNANVRQAALGLELAGLLTEFHTCIGVDGTAGWLKLLPPKLARELRRRALPEPLGPRMRFHPWREAGRLVASRFKVRTLTRHERGPLSIDRVYQALDATVARRVRRGVAGVTAVYAYEDGATETFAAARDRGVRRFYDLPIGYWRTARRLLTEEAELSPEWAATMHGNRDSPAKTARKDAELAGAETIFVASSYTKSTLRDAPAVTSDVLVVPYGAPPTPAGFVPARRAPGEPLRVLFVGSLGQRKGIRYLLEALAAAGPGFALTLIGAPPVAPCAPLAAGLQRHRHIASLPHSAILEAMAQHHVLVFPSLFEGFGLVVLEAMSRGLPVIATPHTAGPDVLRDGQDGFIVPIRDPAAIAAKLTWLAEDEDRRQAMSASALARAATFTWEAYGRALATALRTRLAA